MPRRYQVTVAELPFFIETMSCHCVGDGSSRRAANSGETRPLVHDVRLRWRLQLPFLILVFAVASELQLVPFYKGALAAPCEDSYFSCVNSRQAGVAPLCSCHSNCSLYDACCEDVRPNDWRRLALPQDAYQCSVYPAVGSSSQTNVKTVIAAEFVFLITKCPSTYGASYVANLCTEPSSKIGSTNEQPIEQWVTDNTTGVTYSNRFCAFCYGVPANRMIFWDVLDICINEIAVKKFGLSGCNKYQVRPFSSKGLIPTCLGRYYAACPNETQQQMQEACLNNPARYVYDYTNFRTYRNDNCSICASSGTATVSEYRCTPYPTNAAAPFIIGVQGALGIDNCPKKIVSFATSDEQTEFTKLCPDTVFDADNCSETVNVTVLQTSYGHNGTLEYRITQNGVRLLYNFSYTLCYRCLPNTTFNYTVSPDNAVQLASNDTYSKPLFQVEADGSVTVCSASQPIELPSSPCTGLPSEVDVVLMSLSLVGLGLYAVAYAALSSLQNLPGQIVLHQSVAFFAAFLLWLLRAPARHSSEACVALGVLTHFFFLAAFTWTTVYAVEVVRALGFQAYGTGYTKRRLWYTMVGWLVPTVITVIAIAVNWAPLGSVEPRYRPSYGSPQCFINNPAPHRIFFTAPLAALLLIDVAIYVYIVVQLVVISGQTRMVRENHHEKLALAFKLVFALGITWIFALLATAMENCIIAYIFSVLNSLQGVFVFFIFVFNARTLGQIRHKMRGPKSLTTGVTTEVTGSSRGTSSSSTNALPKRKNVLGVNSFSPVSLAMDAQEHGSEPPPH